MVEYSLIVAFGKSETFIPSSGFVTKPQVK